MKKIIALLLAFCLAVSLFGCSEADPAATTTPTGGSTTPDNHTGFTVSDADASAAANTIVATCGDRALTVGELNVFYWMGIYSFLSNYGSYVAYFGLDPSLPLGDQVTQTNDGTETTWERLFIDDALSAWHLYQAVAQKAKQMNIPMPDYLQTELDSLRDVMKDSAEERKFESVDAMIQAEAGAAASGDAYYAYQLHYYEYVAALVYLEQTTEITQDDIEAYFQEHKDDLSKDGITKESGNVFGVRHILISPEGGTTDGNGNTTYSEDEWEACRIKAQNLLDQWIAGEATEDSFSDLAKEHSTDPGSKSNGGLYEDLNDKTSFVQPFKDWYLAEGRQVGDYGLIKTDYGYHLMYLSSIEAQWIAHCHDAVFDEIVTKFLDEAQAEFPMDADYDKIVLGYVSLVSES